MPDLGRSVLTEHWLAGPPMRPVTWPRQIDRVARQSGEGVQDACCTWPRVHVPQTWQILHHLPSSPSNTSVCFCEMRLYSQFIVFASVDPSARTSRWSADCRDNTDVALGLSRPANARLRWTTDARHCGIRKAALDLSTLYDNSGRRSEGTVLANGTWQIYLIADDRTPCEIAAAVAWRRLKSRGGAHL
jgi:hypothetical protein